MQSPETNATRPSTHDHLAMVAADPAERGARRGGLNARTSPPALTSGLNSPKRGRRSRTRTSRRPARTLTPSRALRASRSTNRRPTAIAMDDVHLHVNRATAASRNRPLPGRIVLAPRRAARGRRLPRDERRAGRSAERLIGERPQRGAVVARRHVRQVEDNGHPIRHHTVMW